MGVDKIKAKIGSRTYRVPDSGSEVSLRKYRRPNILFVMSDDHAAHALSCYGSRINKTPQIDRIANEGIRFDNCFSTNSICVPSRASILTGTYSNINGVKSNEDRLDGRQATFPQLLQAAGYQTAMIGKWHLGHGSYSDPTGFDYWNILPDQGEYFNPEFIEMGVLKQYEGYVTDITTDLSLDWLNRRDNNKPFMLLCQHKAPHRPFEPDEKYADLYEDVFIPEPVTFYDDYATRTHGPVEQRMEIDHDLYSIDFTIDALLKGLTPLEFKQWVYQRFIKDYLRCVASIDDSVGRLLDYLDREGIAEDTIVIYTSDQGFFLGDHAWFDKRFMFEESIRMPFLVRYPREIKPCSVTKAMALNVDIAPTMADYAGVPVPAVMQGRSLRPLFNGITPKDWRTSMYYRYWEHLDRWHNTYAHYGIRTYRYKLIFYYARALGTLGAKDEIRPQFWELYDLENDPYEIRNVYTNPEYSNIVTLLKVEMTRLQRELLDQPVYET